MFRISIGLWIVLMACVSTRVKPLQMGSVSMTTTEAPPCLKPGAMVKEIWCQGDRLLAGTPDRYGLFDEVIVKAQRKHGVDYLLDNSLYLAKEQGTTCALLEAHLPKACSEDTR